MSAQFDRFDKRSRAARSTGYRLGAVLAVAFILAYVSIAVCALISGSSWPAFPGTTELYPGL